MIKYFQYSSVALRLLRAVLVALVVPCLVASIRASDNGSDLGVSFAPIADQTVVEDTRLTGLPFKIVLTGTNFGSIDASSITATSSNAALIPDRNIRVTMAGLGPDGISGTLDIIPASNQNGSATITLNVSTVRGTAQLSFLLTVTSSNDAPVISYIPDQTIYEDKSTTGLAFTVDEGGGTDEDAEKIVLSIKSSNPEVISEADVHIDFFDNDADATGGTITITPIKNKNGTAVITLTVADEETTVEQTFTVTVQATNDPPTISSIPDQVIEEDTMTQQLSYVVDEGGGIDEDHQSLIISATSSNTTLVPDNNIQVIFSDAGISDATGGSVVVTPAADQNGITKITLAVNDGSEIVHSSFNLQVTAVDDPPVISKISSQLVNEDTPLKGISFTVDEGGGSDEDSQIVELSVATANETLIPESNIFINFVDDETDARGGSIAITPGPNEFGAATITLTLSDGNSSVQETVVVNINPVNDPPTIGDIPDQESREDTPVADIAFAVDEGGGVREDSQVLTVRVSSSNTTLVPDQNITVDFADDAGDATGGTIAIVPAPDQNGTATITVVVDDRIASVQESFTLSVVSENDPPEITNLSEQHTDEDRGLSGIFFEVDEGGDSDEDVQVISLTASSTNELLVATEDIRIEFADGNADATGGTLSIEPRPNESGTTMIVLTATDGIVSIEESFQLTVDPVNDPPEIGSLANQTIIEDSVLTGVELHIDEGGGANEDSQVLTVRVASSNTALIPVSNIKVDFTDDATDASSGTLEVRPARDQNGTATIKINVTDGINSSQETFVIEVVPDDDPPVLSEIADQTTNEDIPVLGIAFQADEGGSSDEDSQAITLSAVSSNSVLIPPDHIKINFSDGTTDATGGTISIWPAPDKNGSATITLEANDGNQRSQTSFQFDVLPVNDSPSISNLSDRKVREDETIEDILFNLTSGGGSDEENQDLSIRASSSNTTLVPDDNITVEFSSAREGTGGEGVISITPAPDETGRTTVTLTLTDGIETVIESFDLTVESHDDPPTMSEIPDQTTSEDTPISAIAFTVDEGGGNDEDPQTLKIAATSSNQDLVPDANIAIDFFDDARDATGGTIGITPQRNQSGKAVITLVVSDGRSRTERQFTITVTPVNDAPSISEIPDQETLEDQSISGIKFTADEGGGDDEDQDIVKITATSSNTTLIPDENIVIQFSDDESGSTISGTIAITPAPNQNGTATITIVVADEFDSSIETFIVNVTPVNDSPLISTITDRVTIEDVPTSDISFDIDEGGSTDEDQQVLTITATSFNKALVPDSNIRLKYTDDASDASSGVVMITPAEDQNGVATISILVNDGEGTTSEEFSVIVSPTDDVPVISLIPDQETDEDTPLTGISFTADEGGGEDEDVQVLTFAASSSDQTIVTDANIRIDFSDDEKDATAGTISIVPIANESGTTTITISASDGTSVSRRSFLLRVHAVDDKPIALSDSLTTNEDQPIRSIRLRATELDNDRLIYRLVTSGTKGTATMIDASTGEASYTPDPDLNGTDSFSFKVNDGISDSAAATIKITINAVEDPPSIDDIPDQHTREDTPILAIPFNVREGGGDDEHSQILMVSTGSSNPQLIPPSNIRINFSDGTGPARGGTLDITPIKDRYGTALITVEVTDGRITTSTTFSVTIDPVDDPPVITKISDQRMDKDTRVATIPFSADEGGAADEDAQSLTVTVRSSNTNLVPNENIRVNFLDDDGSAKDGTIEITPIPNEYGATTITVTVSDGTNSVTADFVLSRPYTP